MREPRIVPEAFSDANLDIIGPSGGISAVLFCEKEGFNPLFKPVNLANRYDLMIISTKGVSVTAARQLVDNICGGHDLPLFVLHDFDVAGFLILGTLQRDTRRFSSPIISRSSISACGLPTSRVLSESPLLRPRQARASCALNSLRMARRTRRSPSY